MADIVRTVDRCRVCGRSDWAEVVSFGNLPLASDFRDPSAPSSGEQYAPLEVVVCRDCRLVSLRHVVDPELLFGHDLRVAESDQIMNHMRRIVTGSGLSLGDLVVEFGSGVGTHLEMFRESGMRVVGVDPARDLAKIANERGVETVAEPFTADVGAWIAQAYGPARMVLGRQCFAQVNDVHEVLDGVTSVLAPDGVLAVEVPYLADLLTNDQFDTIFHERLSYFSLGTLRRLFAAHGLRVLNVWRTAAVHGGSIVVFAVPETSTHRALPVVDEMLAREDELGLTRERTYVDFADRTEVVRAKIGNLVRALVDDGKTVAGYGAPAKGSTLLNACGLTQAEVRFCTDTTRLKQGRLLPGSRIPVVSPEEGRARRPDYFLLLDWTYADEIIGRERAFLKAGGRFIVPIPRPRVVSADSSTAPV